MLIGLVDREDMVIWARLDGLQRVAATCVSVFFVCLFFNSRCGEKNVLCIRGVKPHSVYACVAISSLNGSTQGRGVRC